MRFSKDGATFGGQHLGHARVGELGALALRREGGERERAQASVLEQAAAHGRERAAGPFDARLDRRGPRLGRRV